MADIPMPNADPRSLKVMANLPVPNADPPGDEEPRPMQSELQIVDEAKDDQMCLSDLHQCYIEQIAKHLDLKSLLQLQFTCKKLFQKGLNAQPLITHRFDFDYRNGEFISRFRGRRRNVEEQFKATKFRIQAFLHINDRLSVQTLQHISDVLKDRGTIEELRLHSVDLALDLSLLNDFLKTFKVTKISIGNMPVEFFQLPAVKQMSSLNIAPFYVVRDNESTPAYFPLHIRYFLDTEILSTSLYLERRANRPDSEDMHDILEKLGMRRSSLITRSSLTSIGTRPLSSSAGRSSEMASRSRPSAPLSSGSTHRSLPPSSNSV